MKTTSKTSPSRTSHTMRQLRSEHHMRGIAPAASVRLKTVILLGLALWTGLPFTRAEASDADVSPGRPLTAEQQKRLAEWDRLYAQAKKLHGDGKLAEAVAIAEQMLAIDREVYGRVHTEVAFTLD